MSSTDPVSDSAQVSADPTYFLHSPVFLSLVAAFITTIATILGRHLTPDQINTYVQDAVQLITLCTLAFGAYKRWRSTLAPLSLTKPKGISNEPIAPVPGSSPPTAAVVGGNIVGFPPRGTPGITEEPQRSKPADPPTLPPAA